MIRTLPALILTIFVVTLGQEASAHYETDILKTAGGDLEITFLGHGSLMFNHAGTIVGVDPYGKVADYEKLRRADLVLITHEHFDHLDKEALEKMRTPETAVIVNPNSASRVEGGIVMKNGETRTVKGITIEAVPAYNIVHKRENGHPYHPRGEGNGYVITFADKRVYVAGDTENIPEMKDLARIDIAFLPMNLPYTMTPEMVADAALMFLPDILYPYHYGDTDPSKLVDLLKYRPEIEVRIRNMQ